MAAGAVLVLLFGKGDWAVGWIVGGAFNIAYFSYLALIAFKRCDRDDLGMVKSLTNVAAGRFFVAILFLLVVLKTNLAHGLRLTVVATRVFFCHVLGRLQAYKKIGEYVLAEGGEAMHLHTGTHDVQYLWGMAVNMDTIYMTWLTGALVLILVLLATRRCAKRSGNDR